MAGVGQTAILERLKADVRDADASFLELIDGWLKIGIRTTNYSVLQFAVTGERHGIDSDPNIDSLFLKDKDPLSARAQTVITSDGSADNRFKPIFLKVSLELSL